MVKTSHPGGVLVLWHGYRVSWNKSALFHTLPCDYGWHGWYMYSLSLSLYLLFIIKNTSFLSLISSSLCLSDTWRVLLLWFIPTKKPSVGQTPRLCNLPSKYILKVSSVYHRSSVTFFSLDSLLFLFWCTKLSLLKRSTFEFDFTRTRISRVWERLRKLNTGVNPGHYWFRRSGTKTSSKTVIRSYFPKQSQCHWDHPGNHFDTPKLSHQHHFTRNIEEITFHFHDI